MGTATRHRCVYGITPRCTRGTGKPQRKKCAGCGGCFVVERGTYGVFNWTGTGQYPLADAVATFTREASADAYADRHAHTATSQGGLVVRWIAAEPA